MSAKDDAIGKNGSEHRLSQYRRLTEVCDKWNGGNSLLLLYICSKHPMACQLIESAFVSEPALRQAIRPFLGAMAPLDNQNRHVLILDTHSVTLWPSVLMQWQSRGHRAVLLVSPQSAELNEKLCGLYYGVYGIVSMESNIASELPQAVRKVDEGELWISQDALSQCAKQAKIFMSQLSEPDPRFTAREDQILKLLMRGYSNKQIAKTLEISERTVKFHVSNVLQKAQIDSRRELLYATQSVGAPANDYSYLP